MAKPTTFPEEHVAEPMVYRRVSGFAIAGFSLAVLFALYLVIAGARGMYDGSPLLLSPSMQALPFLSAALSGIALFLIARSGGLLAGGKLATVGLWISIVFGLGYIAYFVATYFAIRQQADAYVERWFAKLAQGKINAAFLDSIDPAVRLRVNPDDEATMNDRFNAPVGKTGQEMAKGPLDLFRQTDLVRVFIEGGKDVQITPQGVRDWDYRGGGYNVRRYYQLTNAEGVYEVQVAVVGRESKNQEYEGREWTVRIQESGVKKTEMTDLGKQAKHLRPQAAHFIDQWAKKLQAGDLTGAYLDTKPVEERRSLQPRADAALAAAALAAGASPEACGPAATGLRWGAALDAELARCLSLPGYLDEFHRHKLLNTERFRTQEASLRDVLVKAFQALLSPRTGPQAMMAGYFKIDLDSVTMPWKVVDGDRLRLPHDALFGFVGAGPGMYAADAAITVESSHGATTILAEPTWRIASVDLFQGDQVRMPNRTTGGGDMRSPTPIRRPQPYVDPLKPSRRMQ
jgi:hypothetical protein